MDPESGKFLANAASKTALGILDRILMRISGRGRILLNRLVFAPVLNDDTYCMLDQADRIKVQAYISLYSTKSVFTRLFEPTIVIQMKGFKKLRLILAKIDLSKDISEIINEQHVITLEPNEGRSEDLTTYIIEKDRLKGIKKPSSGFKVSLEYRSEGNLKTKIRIKEYFFCEKPHGDPIQIIETKIQKSRFSSWK